jgi:23S rRNA pseudouridine2604 synthase
MCEALGYEVTRLQRVRIMNIPLGQLPEGEWRHLSKKEMKELRSALKHSKKTASD